MRSFIVSTITVLSIGIFVPIIMSGQANAPPYRIVNLPAYAGASTVAVVDSTNVLFLAYVGESHPSLDAGWNEFRSRLFRIFPNGMTIELTRRLPPDCQSTSRPALEATHNALYWTVVNGTRICAAYRIQEYDARAAASLQSIPDDAVIWPFGGTEEVYP